jgi:outer membrane protein
MQRKAHQIFIFLVSFLISLPAWSQTNWSLQDCIDHALKNNLDIKNQQFNELDSEYNLNQSKANFFPSLNADGSHGFSFGRSVDPFTNDFSTERIMRQNAGVSSAVTIFAGLQNVNYLRYNVLNNTAMRYDTESIKNEIILTIASAFLQVLYFEDYLETAVQQTEIVAQQVERNKALYEAGTLPRGSVLEIEATLADEELKLINARNDLRLAYLELIQLLDLNPEEEFSINKPASTAIDELTTYNPDEVFAKAMQIQPYVLAANTRVLMAEKQIDLEKGRLSPALSLVASMSTGYSEAAEQFSQTESTGPVQIGYLADNTPVFTDGITNIFETKPYSNQIRDNFSQYVGVNLRIPIFNRWEVKTRIQQSRVDLDRARNQYDITRNNLNKTIHQAHADALAAWQKYQATVKSLDAFNESFTYTQERFNLGMVSSVEFNESQARMARAQTEALQARYDYIFKTKILEFYMGEGFTL